MPQWTERAEKRGLDPLGLQNSGVALYQTLLPGISNVTPRLRYFGYYCWVSDTYAKRVGETDPETWRTWIRRSEALLALVSAEAGGESGVGGIEWATGVLLDDPLIIDFAPAAGLTAPRLYLKQRMGVFGGAYVSQLIETGLFALSDEHAIAIASARSGRRLAELFRSSIGDAEGPLIEAIETGAIQRGLLADLGVIAPSQIPLGSGEAQLYLDLLSAALEGARDSDRNRRDSLRMVLAVAAENGEQPSPEDVRWRLFDPTMSLPDDLAAHRLSWEAYHAHDLFQLAAAGLFACALSRLGGQPSGFTYAEVSGELQLAMMAFDIAPGDTSWSEVLPVASFDDEALQSAAVALGRASTSGEEQLELAVRVIATIHHRVRTRPDLAAEIEDRFVLAPSVRSIRSELDWLETRRDQSAVLLMASYLVERVLKRHAEVALRKLRYQRDYTFHFEAREGRLVRRLSYVPVLTSPRLGSAIQILRDLGLLNENGASTEGLRFIEAADAAA